MSAKYIKLILIVSLLLGLLLCILGCVNVMPYFSPKGDSNSVSVRGLQITMDVDKREEFISQLQKFADKHSLGFSLTLYDADKNSFLVEIKGDGFHINSAASRNFPADITLGFFNDASTPTPQKTVDELFDSLKSYINEIPNVMMTETRKAMRIKIDESQRKEFFTQMQKLANKHSLEFNLTFSPDKTLFLLEINGNGFHVTSSPNSIHPGEIDIYFDIDYYKAPTSTSLEAVDELFDELNSQLGEIPNVTITEEK